MRLADDGSIRVLGRQNKATLDALMDSSDVLVVPSLVEGFGLVITEALAHGLHVIATSHTGAQDLPTVPGAVSLVPAGDLDALERAILGALDESGFSPSESYDSADRWTWADYRNGVVSMLDG